VTWTLPSGHPQISLPEVCDALGYPSPLRSVDFRMWTGKRSVDLDIACFTRREPKDMSTAALIAGAALSPSRQLELRDGARYLAAPAVLLDVGQRIELWRVGRDVERDQRLREHVVLDDDPDLGRLRDALSPAAVMRAKHEQQGQMTFFDIDVTLLREARTRLGGGLASRVRAASAALWPTTEEPTPDEARALARTVVQALTVLAVRDKMTDSKNFTDAVALLQERFGNDLALADLDMLAKAAELIGEGVAFDGLDATLLSDLYENSILSKETRKHLGAYYTPPALARRILAEVPVDYIAPEDRRVLDVTCGSGTLLLAASERLAQGVVHEAYQSHEYVRERLVGFDRDGFAVELTKLALLLHALPLGNGWNVTVRDALVPRGADEMPATIVVGNPPWRFKRGGGATEERASAFLDAMFNWCADGGFVAAVMPASWLTGATARGSRRAIRDIAEIFEVWRLPRSMFRSSDAPPCVIFAQKDARASPGRWLYRTVGRGHEDDFYAGRDWAFAAVLASGETADGPLAVEPPNLTRQLKRLPILSTFAYVRGGAPADNADAIGKHGGPYLCLTKSTVTPPFGAVARNDLIPCRYPADFSRGKTASPSFYLRPKVLVAVTNSVDSPNRTRAMTDELRVIPRNSLVAVVPHENQADNRLALTAILGSRVVNGWLQTATTRQIRVDQIKQLPVPEPAHWPRLARATEAVQVATESGDSTEDARKELERAVERAYGLDDDARREVAALLGEPPGDLRELLAAVEDETLTVGNVLKVEDGRLLLYVAGVTPPGGEWVAPPGGMPGWLMRSGATFDVFGFERGLERARYVAQEMAWRSDDDLFPTRDAVG
jgi:predicted RNA methylase